MQTPTLYVDRDSGLHRLHPLTKLTAAGLFVVAAATSPTIPWILSIYLGGLLPLALWGRVLNRFLRASLLIVWPFALSLFLIQGFFTAGEQVLFQLGPLAYKLEGAKLAAFFTSRLLVWLGTATLLMLVTRPDMLMSSLTEAGLPRQIAYIVLTSLQIIPRFQGRALTILDAQRSRGLETEGSVFRRARALVPLVAPLVLSSILELDERAMALEARAFSRRGRRTSYVQLTDSIWQIVIRWSMAVVAVLLILRRIIGSVSA
jgi:energy-coupling factor transport system permease protein